MNFLALSLLAISITPLAFSQTIPSGWVNIVSQNSGKCLDVIGGPGAIAPGVRADQWDCAGTSATNQIFRLIPEGAGYQIQANNSGLAVEPLNGATSNGTRIVQEPYMGDNYQAWQAVSEGNGYYELHPMSHKSSCADVIGQSKLNNAYVQEYACWGGPNQLWKFVPIAVNNRDHTVSLTWTSSVSGGVLSYNIYRGLGTGAMSKIASGITGTSYEDSSVIDGDGYRYAATAVDSNDDESGYSNIFSITVPTT